MVWIELLLSFVIGIASGIVSSVLVTIYYRRKDAERDRQAFFSALRAYIGGLIAIDANDMDAMVSYFSATEAPRIYSWIKLTKDENAVILEMFEAIWALQDVLTQHREEYVALLNQIIEQNEKCSSPDDVADAVTEKYLPQLLSARATIHKINFKIQALGNRVFQETIAKLKKDT